jgi:four helix bundle protein
VNSEKQKKLKGDMAERPHKKLDAWKKSIELTVKIYELTGKLPKAEQFGLVSQMRRAAVSIGSNISEGAARNTKKEFLQSLYIAQGSLAELDTQIIICYELGYFSDQDIKLIDSEIESEGKLISGLIRYLKKQS